jgi:hypothetical protein
MRIRGENGDESLVTVNDPTLGPNGVVKQNDLSVGKYDLIASVGASFSSKRQEMVETLVSSLQYAPQLANVIAPFIFKFSDWPGAQEVYSEIKKTADAQQQMQMQQMAAAGGQPPAGAPPMQ